MSTPDQQSGDEVELLDAIHAVLKHPEWYFRSGEFSSHEVLALLAAEAITHGVKDLGIRNVSDCWVLHSSTDWLGGDVASFFALKPDVEAGPNTSRVEILLTAFCQAVWTGSAGQVFNLGSRIDAPSAVAKMLADARFGRIVAFLGPASVHQRDALASTGEVAPSGLSLVPGDLSDVYEEALQRLGTKQTNFRAGRGWLL